MIEELYTVLNIIIKNAKVNIKSTMVKKKIFFCTVHASCIKSFLKEARLGASFDSFGRLFHILTPL